jgi:hypothetical protein
MSRREFGFLQSEVATLEGLLANLSQDRVIERLGFERRLNKARQQLALVSTQPRALSLPITFRGDPVEGSRSIDASFATKALRAFVEATDTVAASLTAADLKGIGPLPGSGGRSLRIVDTVLGSFGFELELPPLSTTLWDLLPGSEPPDPYVDAITTTFNLISQSASMDENAITDLVADIHPRAAAKVRAFAKVLFDHHALFAAEFEGRQIRLDRHEEVQHVMELLDGANINETFQTLSATIQGILPDARVFEAKLAAGEVVKGKIDRSLPNIQDFKAMVENTTTLLQFRVVNVRSNRRYVLMGTAEEQAV